MATVCNKCNNVCRVHYGSLTRPLVQQDTRFTKERVALSDCCEATTRVLPGVSLAKAPIQQARA